MPAAFADEAEGKVAVRADAETISGGGQGRWLFVWVLVAPFEVAEGGVGEFGACWPLTPLAGTVYGIRVSFESTLSFE